MEEDRGDEEARDRGRLAQAEERDEDIAKDGIPKNQPDDAGG